MNTGVTAVVFDWDSTLAQVLGDAPTSHKIAALFQSRGLNYLPYDIERAIQIRQQGIQDRELSQRGQLQTRREVMHYYQELLTILGSQRRDRLLASELYEDFARLPVELYDDSLPTLESLTNAGFKLGIITNNSASARQVIEKSVGSFVRVEHIVISEELGVHKPAKTIFLRMASRLRVKPSNCVYVGDNLHVDAIAAVRNGGYRLGLWINRSSGVDGRPELLENVIRITSLNDVTELLIQSEG